MFDECRQELWWVIRLSWRGGLQVTENQTTVKVFGQGREWRKQVETGRLKVLLDC